MSSLQHSIVGMEQLLAHVPRAPAVFEGLSFTNAMPPPKVLEETEFRGCRFQAFTWQGAMSKVRFINCKFDRVEWQGVSLAEVKWEDCELADATWTRCRLSHVLLSGGRAERVRFDECEVHFATITCTALRNVRFASTRVVQTVASGAQISSLQIDKGEVQDVTLADCQLDDVHAESVDMQRFICAQSTCIKVEFLNCVGQSIRWVACTLRDLRFMSTKLSQCAWSLSEWTEGRFEDCSLHLPAFDGAVLEEIDWVRSSATRPLFDGAKLTRCSLFQQHMPAMSLRSATLESVDLRELQSPELDARGARLSQVEMSKANFIRANLIGQRREAWLTANVDRAVFEEAVDLRDEHWWVKHSPGPKNRGHEDEPFKFGQ